MTTERLNQFEQNAKKGVYDGIARTRILELIASNREQSARITELERACAVKDAALLKAREEAGMTGRPPGYGSTPPNLSDTLDEMERDYKAKEKAIWDAMPFTPPTEGKDL